MNVGRLCRPEHILTADEKGLQKLVSTVPGHPKDQVSAAP